MLCYTAAGDGSIQNRTLLRGGENREPLREQPWLKLSNPRPSYTLAPTHTRVSPTPLEGACTVQCAPMRARCSSPRKCPLALRTPCRLDASLALSRRSPSHFPPISSLLTRTAHAYAASSPSSTFLRDFRPLLRIRSRPTPRVASVRRPKRCIGTDNGNRDAGPRAAPVSYFEVRANHAHSIAIMYAVLYGFHNLNSKRNISILFDIFLRLL